MADEIKMRKSAEDVALTLFYRVCEMGDAERVKELEIYAQCLAATTNHTIKPLKHG